MDERAYWIWLQQALGAGGTRVPDVLRFFGTARCFYEAGPSAWAQFGTFTVREREMLRAVTLEQAQEILKRCESLGQRVLTPETEGYPERLKSIYSPPCALYVRGTLPAVDRVLSIAVVGSRKASYAGLQAAFRISQGLARAGAVVISGGARGVDHTAHEAALSAGGTTVSVLPCGIDYPYLMEFRSFRAQIAERGALLSEYPPGTQLQKWTFRVRNRILSGLSAGIVVAEASAKSGTMITARYALEQDRDVFAVPANVGPQSDGSNGLIRMGAKLVTCAEDILEEYEGRYERVAVIDRAASHFRQELCQSAPMPLAGTFSADAKTVYRALGEVPVTIGELTAATGLSAARLLSALTELEMEEKIRSYAGRRYAITETAYDER